ncbi:hypothetical protein EYF80_061175 [Liparis tanakae]|uniref:Uncharacterized protein n=1 Tax=Liparis tanakae TaxID=230148 RepID=A0A4Z2EIU4_9TELE|nr:hypothetical protein EYF80_061175 [Liparis tanakae]
MRRQDDKRMLLRYKYSLRCAVWTGAALDPGDLHGSLTRQQVSLRRLCGSTRTTAQGGGHGFVFQGM